MSKPDKIQFIRMYLKNIADKYKCVTISRYPLNRRNSK